jgi:uncharacterized membrane protein YphA (DoxX/SURF4 family)
MSKGKTIALWVVSGLVAALFLFAGGSKLVAPQMAKTGFIQAGYAAWFATFIGVCEVLGAIGLLIPRLAGLAAACLSVIMVGATYTVIARLHQSTQAPMPIVVFFLLLFIAYTRFTKPRSASARAASPGN